MSNPMFENPYNFVPAPPRNTTHPELGDHGPVGHHRYHPGFVSGTVDIEIETITPLLIPDEGQEDANRHRRFGLRLDHEGAPVLPATSLKGMLRAAYEAVTNSRFGVFHGHDDPLGFRPPATAGLKLIPARVSDNGTHLELHEGMNDGSQYAAWVPIRRAALPGYRTPTGRLHGTKVYAWIEKRQHSRRSGGGESRRDFSYWQVVLWDQNAPPPARPSNHAELVEGYFCINGLNMNNKHDERLFFTKPGHTPRRVPLSDELKRQWRTLISNYRAVNQRELDKGQNRPSALREGCQWSRHIKPGDLPLSSEELSPGTLCYAEVVKEQNKDVVKALYPVLISRQLYPYAPARLLHPSLAPAVALDQLSPADRVFGWVNQAGEGASRGKLRIGPVRCASGPQAVQRFSNAVPLAILAAPKPQQARFYGAQDKDGTPFPRRFAKAELWSEPTHGLRGRKVYPHHGVLDTLPEATRQSYWQDNGGKVESVAHIENRPIYREWLRLKNGNAGRTDDQNRSVTAWVKPGTRFRTTLHLTNLSPVEAGALLWLLDLPEGHYHRLGGGKPLGFGSVRIRIQDCQLADGQALAAYYRSFGATPPARLDPAALITAFCHALLEAYPPKAASPNGAGSSLALALARAGVQSPSPAPDIAAIPFIRAFLNACKGGTLPVHYPRCETAPDPAGKQYEWFVANEKLKNGQCRGEPLPSLGKDLRGLPYCESSHDDRRRAQTGDHRGPWKRKTAAGQKG